MKNREQLINTLKERIEREYRKHQNLLPDEWARIAAIRVLNTISAEGYAAPTKAHDLTELVNSPEIEGSYIISKTNPSIFLIEKAWLDPLENRDACGYEPFGYAITEEEAKSIVNKNGVHKPEECWAIKYIYPKGMPKYRYKELRYCG